MLKRQSIINCKKRVALNINYVKVEQKLKSISQSGNLKLSFTLFDEKQLLNILIQKTASVFP